MIDKFERTNKETKPDLVKIKSFEDSVSVKLPKTYTEFLLLINGGNTKKVDFDLCTIDRNYATGDCPFLVEIEDFFSFEELSQIWDYTKDEYLEKKSIPNSWRFRGRYNLY